MRLRAAGGRAATAASSASVSSPGAPARTSAAPSAAVVRTEGADERGEVLAPLDGADGEHERAERRRPRRHRGHLGGRHGERPEVDDLDPRRVEQLAGGVGGRLAGRVDHGTGSHAPAEDLTGPADVGGGLVRVTQEPAVVDRHDRRPAGGWDDVVGAVDDVGGAEPAVDTGVVTSGPQPVGDGGRERQPAHRGRRPGSEAQHVRLEDDVGAALEGGAQLGDGRADTGAVAVEGPDVEGDANRIHGVGRA